VTGCYAQVDAETVSQLPGVDLVLGNPDKSRLVEMVEQLRGNGHPPSPPRRGAAHSAAGGSSVAGRGATVGRGAAVGRGDTWSEGSPSPLIAVSHYGEQADFESEAFTHFYGYTRAFLKIQNGCDSHCAYCIIPAARGPSRSMPAAQVHEQVRLLGERGFQEVVLTGIHLGCWGRDTGEGSLADLLRLLLDAPDESRSGSRGNAHMRDAGLMGSPRPWRFRLSSIEPLEMDRRLIEVIASAGERVAHHFHLPLQSGSDSVLRRMGRPYTSSQYLAVVETLAARFPQAALGADVIVGFPGETDKEFRETLAFVERTPLNYLHVFAYSDRPGTPASRMRPKISPEIIRERSASLRDLAERKKEAFRTTLRGTEQTALVLHEQSSDGRWVGMTGNYAEVLVSGEESLANRFVRVRLEKPRPDGRWEVTLEEVRDGGEGRAQGEPVR